VVYRLVECGEIPKCGCVLNTKMIEKTLRAHMLQCSLEKYILNSLHFYVLNSFPEFLHAKLPDLPEMFL
jgi:hypothetical protein